MWFEELIREMIQRLKIAKKWKGKEKKKWEILIQNDFVFLFL